MSEKRITEESRYAGLALAEEELVARVAWCYYHDGLTQNDIGERLGLPRLKISRLLEKGRQSGVIRVQINSRYEGCLALETELQQRFDLKIARVLPALNTPPMNTRLGIGAAQSLMGVLEPGQLLAVGFGEATMSCLQHLSGFISSQQVRLGALSGGQRQAATLIMATLTPIEFLILDEHTAALDPKTADIIMELTNKVVQEKHLTAMMVTHNLRYAVEYGSRLIMMDKGHIVLDKAGEEKVNTKVDDILDIFTKISIECGN